MLLEQILKYPVVFAVGAVLSLLLARAWGPRALRWGFVDRPGGRKEHGHPVPTAGGIAVFLAFHAACAAVFLLPWRPFAGQVPIDWWLRFLPLSAGMAALGFLDDRFNLPPAAKLAGQVALIATAYAVGLRIETFQGVPLPGGFDFLFTMLWFLALTNAFNLIDGVDGLAAGIAVIASVGVAASLLLRHAPGDVLLFLGLAGACAGFLRYNFYPARVFLGDTGSLFIGFAFAALALSTHSKGPATAAIAAPLLAAGIPLFDSLLAIWRRTVRRVRAPNGARSGALLGVGEADAEHLHHRLLREGRAPRQVALLLYAGTAGLVALGLLVTVFNDRALGILSLAFLAGAYTVVRHLAWIELRDSGEAVMRGLATPVRRNRTLLVYVVLDLAVLGGVLALALYAMQRVPGAAHVDLRRQWVRHAPLDIGLPFLALLLFRSYSRVWYLARISEYAATGLAVVLGYAIALGIHLTGSSAAAAPGPWIVRFVLLAGVAAPAVVGLRAALRVAQDASHGALRALRGAGERGERTLVCGAGHRTTLFLRELAWPGVGGPALDVVGLVADDSALRGHRVYGIPVLGHPEDVPRLVREHRVRAVYLVEDVPAEIEERMRAAAAEAGARVVRWEIVERELAPGGQGAGENAETLKR